MTRLEVDSGAARGKGKTLLPRSRQPWEFELTCVYPTVFESEAARDDAPLDGPQVGSGPNAASAVLRLTCGSRVTLFGGDLDYQGWRRLAKTGHDLHADVFLISHHGAPADEQDDFGPHELANAIDPGHNWYALISVGTRQPGRCRHPARRLVRALAAKNATVMCTELTHRCADSPEEVGGVLKPDPRASSTAPESGVPRAGTIVVGLGPEGDPFVLNEHEHRVAVRSLVSDPLCCS